MLGTQRTLLFKSKSLENTRVNPRCRVVLAQSFMKSADGKRATPGTARQLGLRALRLRRQGSQSVQSAWTLTLCCLTGRRSFTTCPTSTPTATTTGFSAPALLRLTRPRPRCFRCRPGLQLHSLKLPRPRPSRGKWLLLQRPCRPRALRASPAPRRFQRFRSDLSRQP